MSKAREIAELGDVLTVSGSNVGIGTSSPEEKLHVQGSLKVDFGSAGGNPRVYLDHDSATDDGNYLQLNRGDDSLEVVGQDNVKIRTNGSERVRIDSAGRVTMPYQPSFKVATNYSTQTYIAGAALSHTAIEYDIGNNFANSRFTAPVAGVYHFDVSVFVRAVSAGSGFSYIALMKNGSVIYPYAHSDNGNITNYEALSLSRTVQLTANDYVQVYAFNHTSHKVYNGTSYNHFSGHLIG
jgi:hypothetical protein